MENRLATAKDLLYHDDKLNMEDRTALFEDLKIRDVRPIVSPDSGEEKAD